MATPTVGRTVLFHLSKTEDRPATVVRTFDGYDRVNLQVLIDGTNDRPEIVALGYQPQEVEEICQRGTLWRTSVAEGTAPMEWSWPKRD